MRLRYLWLVVVALCFLSCADDAGDAAGAAGEASDGPGVQLRSVVQGMSIPLMVTQPDDGSGRLFVVDQTGQVLIVPSGGEMLDEPFLDLSDELVDLDPDYDERGLLGLAFHPDYADNGRFFVYYSAPLRDDAVRDDWDHTSHIAELAVSDDPDRADPDSERLVLAVDQPYNNHNGGQIAFGPDGYLYIPLGDGGDGGDTDAEGEDLGRPEMGNGQTTETILGNILRIDVDDGDPYGIPDDNVFVGDDRGLDEIYAYGFRNPYGLSFDHETGDLYIADAGQARYEEVSLVEPGGNHGWNIREGTHCFDPDDFLNPPDDCPDTGPLGEPLVDPVIEYERGPESGSVVVPGVMNRGTDVPELEGHFVFGDYGAIRYLPTGILYAAAPDGEGQWPIERVSIVSSADEAGDLNRFLLGVDQDLDGRMYALTSMEGGPTGTTGEVFVIEAADEGGLGGVPGLLWLVGGIVAVIAILGAALMAARRRERSPPAEGGVA